MTSAKGLSILSSQKTSFQFYWSLLFLVSISFISALIFMIFFLSADFGFCFSFSCCIYVYVCIYMYVCVCLYNWITAVHQKITQHYKPTILELKKKFFLDREFFWPDPRKDFSGSKGAANKRCGDPLGCNHYALLADSFKWDHSTQQLEGTLLDDPSLPYSQLFRLILLE